MAYKIYPYLKKVWVNKRSPFDPGEDRLLTGPAMMILVFLTFYYVAEIRHIANVAKFFKDLTESYIYW